MAIIPSTSTRTLAEQMLWGSMKVWVFTKWKSSIKFPVLLSWIRKSAHSMAARAQSAQALLDWHEPPNPTYFDPTVWAGLFGTSFHWWLPHSSVAWITTYCGSLVCTCPGFKSRISTSVYTWNIQKWEAFLTKFEHIWTRKSSTSCTRVTKRLRSCWHLLPTHPPTPPWPQL